MGIAFKPVSNDIVALAQQPHPLLGKAIDRHRAFAQAPALAAPAMASTESQFGYSEYVLDGVLLAGGHGLESARLIGQIVQLTSAHALIVGGKRIGLTPGSAPLTPTTAVALSQMAGFSPSLVYEPRYLRIPSLCLQAVWLSATDPAQDRLVFRPPTPKEITAGVLLEPESVFAVLKPLAQNALNTAEQ